MILMAPSKGAFHRQAWSNQNWPQALMARWSKLLYAPHYLFLIFSLSIIFFLIFFVFLLSQLLLYLLLSFRCNHLIISCLSSLLSIASRAGISSYYLVLAVHILSNRHNITFSISRVVISSNILACTTLLPFK
jgi:hypothetical protein